MEVKTSINMPLAEAWKQLKEEQPEIRIRNAAEALKVSEAELLATQCGNEVVRLRPEFKAILTEIEKLGKVMALTRNEHVVHERKGEYLNPMMKHPVMGLFVGEDIDLRIFFTDWAFAFGVEQISRGKPRHSIQFFAQNGEAVHKIYLTPQSNFDAYSDLIQKYKAEEQSTTISVSPIVNNEVYAKDEEVAVEAFQQAWVDLKDTHDFYGMLKEYKLSRTQALRLAPEGNYAVPVENSALREIVTAAAKQEVPIMVFVGNRGMIQIHTGPVKKLLDYNEWFNVMDPDFNLHVRETAIKESWVVRKPTEDGVVTALECYDEKGELLVQLFGKRKPGIPELPEWREIVATVESNLKNK